MEFISQSIKDGVCVIALNRPTVLNSFNRQMCMELQQALDLAAKDPQVRAVLLCAEGRAFCAGQDLSEVAPRPDGSLPDLGEIVRSCYNPIVLAIREIQKPVVCCVQGIAAGAGANLALACDIVVASKEASFAQVFSKVGLIPDSGGTFTLPRLIGVAKATALCMLGEKLSAEQAAEIGLIYRVVEASAAREEATKLAAQLAKLPTVGLAATKKAFNHSFQNSLEAQLALEAELQAACGKSADYREGVMAFLEKRAPNFKGC